MLMIGIIRYYKIVVYINNVGKELQKCFEEGVAELTDWHGLNKFV